MSMLRVNARNRCPVCGKPDWCLYDPDGSAAICQRVTSDKRAGTNDAGYLHRFTDNRSTRVTKTKTKADTTDWPAVANRHAKHAGADLLDAVWGLPAGSHKCLPMVGYSPHDTGGPCWTVPMVNGAENVVGISRRYGDGSKKSMGRNGLFVPAGWRHRPGAVFVVEGASDTAAMTAAGLCAVGRPNNSGGWEMLTALLSATDQGRPVVVVAERDEKANGLWPGLEGCMSVARQLKKACPHRAVEWSILPAGYKDVCEYLCGFADGVPWEIRGHSLRDELDDAAVFAGDDAVTLARMVVEMRDAVAVMRERIENL